MASLFLPLLLPILSLLAVADALPPPCSNATCGDQVVRYPFWLLNASTSDCGYPGLGLVCEANATPTLILPVKSHRYRVWNINYDTHTVAVSDADADSDEPAAGGCPRLHVNLTIDYTSSGLQLTQSDSNITFLYNCSKNISWPSAWELSGCYGYSGKRSYVLPDGSTGAEARESECEEVVVAPVLGVHKEGMVGPPGTPAAGAVGEMVKAGFQLMYHAHSRQCGGCERSGGWCGYRRNQTDGGAMRFTCFCDGGPTADRCGAY